MIRIEQHEDKYAVICRDPNGGMLWGIYRGKMHTTRYTLYKTKDKAKRILNRIFPAYWNERLP